MIVTQRQILGYVGLDGPSAEQPLAHRLGRLEAVGRPRGMNADDFRIGVFHGNEDIGPAFPDVALVRSGHVRTRNWQIISAST